MSIKILGGLVKGQALLVPKGDLIRPTSVMLRRKIFDARQDLSGFHFVDLCAGSGAMGLEALSRGASSLKLIEPNTKVFALTKKNLSSILKFSKNLGTGELIRSDAFKFLQSFLISYKNFDQETQESTILFLDPPYELHQVYFDCLELILSSGYCGEVWIESDQQKGVKLSELEKMFPDSKVYRQGTSFILMVR
ncbi:RsmD family RNA methyltransferase [Halobacteriovorax marinus]|uniref:RsmD family RNA methyltransferase n=1 Tax=Halobacteriovorax marinus TaxID=97084 RepID=UPI003A949A6A